ncbi:putative reverse transcriptase domain [Abeliophyllum distichum]|uniref:Reverse transcriptase domain n=1 Tax=Abeliophyllum distichum TaxID=126358 RepID=A0ABD1SZR8_9LAMI
MLSEEPNHPHKSFTGLEIASWNIDRMTEQQILQTISEMSTATSAYTARGIHDKTDATNLSCGFTGQLKNWWFNYLTLEERDKVYNAVKIEGDDPSDPTKQDSVLTLFYTRIKHFVGEPTSFMEKSFELLMNLNYPKLQDFKWYKDVFLQKVMVREDCNSAFLKERFIAGLSKLFAEKDRTAIKDEFSMLPYENLTYGQLIGFINKEGLSLCNDLKLKAKLKSDRMEGRKELSSFCFWQIQIDEKDRYKTTFNVPFGQYKWNVMPFGLKNAPSEFQKIMNDIFNPYQNFSIVYIDDVLIYSDSIEQHVKHLQIFLSIVKKNGLAIFEKKIVLCQTRVKFLGHEIFEVQSLLSNEVLSLPQNFQIKSSIKQASKGSLDVLTTSPILSQILDRSVNLFTKGSEKPLQHGQTNIQNPKTIQIPPLSLKPTLQILVMGES